MNLAKCPLRTKARITSVDVAPQFNLRLQELGVRQGAEFVVVNSAAFGGRVLNIAGTRIAVDHKSVRLIEVETIASEQKVAASDLGGGRLSTRNLLRPSRVAQ